MNSFLTGRSAANLLTRTTAILAGAFFLTSLALTLHVKNRGATSILDAAPVEESAPAVPAAKTAPEAPKKEEKPSVPMAR